MKSFIRWPGLGVFGSAVLLIVLFAFLFADTMVENLIESQGSRLAGAQVDLDEADLSFFPAGLELAGLQVTNPDNPARNIFEIKRIAFSVDPMRLLQRKIIIDEMAVENIRPDTAREKPGRLYPPPDRGEKASSRREKGEGFGLPELSMPDAGEVLAREQLDTLALARRYQEDIGLDLTNCQSKLGDLPDKEKLSGYRDRLAKLRSSQGLGGLLGGASDLADLRNEIRADIDSLKNAQNSFDRVKSTYHTRLAELKEAPGKDIARLVDKYSLSGSGLANLTTLLLGDKAGSVIGQALNWYGKAQPLLQRHKEKKGGAEIVKRSRAKGVTVRFREHEPLPDFLVRTIRASVMIAPGNFTGTVANLTPDQDVLGIPLTFAFGGDSLRGLDSIGFEGVLDHIDPARPQDSFNLKVSGYSIEKAGMSGDESLPVSIEGGLLGISADAVIRQREIDATIRAGLEKANLSAAADQGNEVSRALAGALSDISALNVTAKVTGPLDDYKVRLSSDLDGILQQAAASALKSQTDKFRKELRAGIMEKTRGSLAGAESSFAGLGDISGELSERLRIGGSLLR